MISARFACGPFRHATRATFPTLPVGQDDAEPAVAVAPSHKLPVMFLRKSGQFRVVGKNLVVCVPHLCERVDTLSPDGGRMEACDVAVAWRGDGA